MNPCPFSGCGIVGALALGSDGDRRLPPLDLAAMTACLAHRGPDGEGLYRRPGIALGHRRLSILDPTSRGAQPMRRGSLVIVHNGEVYNFAELRRELEGRGVRFTTGTDTEVVLRAYEAWGPAAVGRFNGMFAFAVWDRERRRLFLARDRLGIKPLYTFCTSEIFLFASEVRPLLASGLVPPEADWEVLFQQALVSSFFQCDLVRTLVRGVGSLPPGSTLTLEADGRRRLDRYWRLPAGEDLDAPDEELAGELLELLDDSVRLRLISDVPVASLLSGGLDSSMITALAAARHGGAPLSALTLCHGGNGGSGSGGTGDDSDSEFARRVVEALPRVDHRTVSPRAQEIDVELLSAITDLASLPDDPRLPAVLANYREVRRTGAKVVLNGEGTDELMGGYAAYNPLVRAALATSEGGDPVAAAWPYLAAPPEALHPDVRDCGEAAFRAVSDRVAAFPGGPLRRCHAFLTTVQVHRILRFEDFLSMRFGVECRVPFLDHRVVEWAFRVPFERHLDEARRTGKMLLRRAARRVLPAAVAERPKQPFPHPDREQVVATLRRLLREHGDEIRGAEAVRRLFAEPVLALPWDRFPAAELGLLLITWSWERALRESLPPAPARRREGAPAGAASVA